MQQVKVDPKFERMLSGYGLTTAQILYRMPDHPAFLQTFSWQFEDVAPDYPRLRRFLDHWKKEVEAAIHSVSISHSRLISPGEVHFVREVGWLQ